MGPYSQQNDWQPPTGPQFHLPQANHQQNTIVAGPYVPRPPTRRRPNRGTPLVATIVVTLLVALGAQHFSAGSSYADPLPAPAASGFDSAGQDSGHATGQRLLPEVIASTAGEYAFNNETDEGLPVAFDPCRTIDWVYNPDGAPDDTESLVREAVDDVSARTGLAFRFVGETDEVYGFNDEVPPGRLVIGWSDEDQVAELADDVAGFGGAQWVESPFGEMRYDSGLIVLDAEDLADELSRRNGRDEVRLVVMHELGHVVGLDHVDDETELMYPEATGQKGWGPGDLAGLALLGQGGCKT